MTTATAANDFSALVEQEITIDAPPAVVFESILEEMNSLSDPQGKSMNLKLEPRVGGRWYRDLGNDAGHLWGLVQVLKPPFLLEITGPLMMSFPVLNHVAYRVTQTGNSCTLSLKHRAFGELDPRFQNVRQGWSQFLSNIQKNATAKHKSR